MEKKNKLQEINKQAALNASRALSKLTDKSVSVEISRAEVKNVEELSPIIGPEEIVAGIYLPVTGDIKGAALLIFPQDSAFTLVDLLVKRKPGSTRQLNELDKSALKEVGNILSGNYLAVFSNKLQVKIIEHVPSFSFDMFGAIVEQIITEFAERAAKALVIEMLFTFKPITLKGYFLILFKLGEMESVLQKKKKKKKKKKIFRELFGETEK